jgi:hypothetical protein
MTTSGLLGGLALIGVMALGSVGCVARVRTGAYVETGPPVVFAAPPTLIAIDSGVWVVRDYDYPVYYYGSAYWVYRDDVWYRSETYDGGWSHIDVNIVPNVIVNRNHRAYIHYRGDATARTRVGPRGQMRPASLDRRSGDVSEPARRGPPERAVEPRHGTTERGADHDRKGNDRGQKKAKKKKARP